MREMKDSGVEWIGEIPIDWDIRQVRGLFQIGRGRVISQQELDENGEYPVYSSQTKDNGCLGLINTYDYDIEQITWTTDGANAGTVFIRNGKHNCTNVCGTLQPNDLSQNLRYQKYALEHIAYYHKRADTNGFKIMNNEMAAIRTICPPLFEQHRIADYLDAKCAQIDRAIARQQEVIEKLKEYKLSVITEAVTKGLNPDVPMKDSGIEWIGEIPEHWEVRKIRWDFSVDLGKMLDAKQISGQYLRDYLRNTDVQWNSINFENLPQMDFQDIELERYQIEAGDLLVCEGGEIGRCAIVPEEFPAPIFYQKALHRVRARKIGNGNVGFLAYVLFSMSMNQYFFDSPEKATIAHLPAETLNGLRIPSPRKEEQKDIIQLLNSECKKIDEVTNKKQQIIDKLTEYKKSLIYEVVTGKREV